MSEVTAESVLVCADNIRRVFLAEIPIWGGYEMDLCLDALLAIGEATGDVHWAADVSAVLARRGWDKRSIVAWHKEPFGQLSWRLAKLAEDRAAYDSVFVAETRKMMCEVPRSPDGLVMHRDPRIGGGKILLDFAQAYAARMARAAHISDDGKLRCECVEQFCCHRNILRNATTGLWSQGRGWETNSPSSLSPGAWSRGQGWILQGLGDALEALPKQSSEFTAVQDFFCELAATLLPLQDEDGLWHALPHLPQNASPAETSGTALICRAYLRGIRLGWLDAAHYALPATQALAAIIERVSREGIITDSCAGPGPLDATHLNHYRGKSFPRDQRHARFSILYACSEALVLH